MNLKEEARACVFVCSLHCLKAVKVTTTDLKHSVQDRLKKQSFKPTSLVFKDTRSRVLKRLYFEGCLLTRSTETHSLLGGASHLFHTIHQDINLEVCLQGRSLRTKVLYVAFFTDINLSPRCPVKLFNITTNDFDRIGNLVEHISLEVFQMVKTILKTNKVVQRPHGIDVIRTRTPTNMED